ncbi:MAG: hypothetical protein MUF06_09215 [Pirellulaceae bacterium]|jgi:hypothetical protein|nr:hypothetical protein [Pirellulaceae bacterium]
MTAIPSRKWLLVVAASVLALCMLGFWSTSGAAPQAGQPPFANPVEQRDATIRELREIKELLKEQNALLRAGFAQGNEAGRR